MKEIRALIIDDSAVMRKMVTRSLTQAGLNLAVVFEAGNGEEALASLRVNQVDLILSDINMPVMDGLEFLRRAKEEGLGGGAPILMITTEGGETHVAQAVAYGASGYIRKPFVPDQVKGCILPLMEKL
jgi:two-component system chemotaxis response regulator CheY